VTISRQRPEPADLWTNIASVPHFYRHLPLMPDARDLWAGLRPLQPRILTGIPSSIATASQDKADWVREQLDASVTVICCASKNKAKFGLPGDILIDDWTKYRPLWEDMGGVFIEHRSARETLDALAQMLQEVA
jgi:5'(3')-deoxyribonucleotidase